MKSFDLFQALYDGEFKSAVFLTYGCNLPYYESVVHRWLSPSCSNIAIFSDAQRVREELASRGSELRRIGRAYTLWPTSSEKVFHPKLILLAGAEEGRLIVGSGNLNADGYGRNLELFSSIDFEESKPGSLPLFGGAWAYIRSLAESSPKSCLEQLRAMEEEAPWLASAPRTSKHLPIWVESPAKNSILEQFQERIHDKVECLSVVSPFWDREFSALQALADTYRPTRIELFIQPDFVSFDSERLRNLAKKYPIKAFHVQQIRNSGRPYVHAKLIVFQHKGRQTVYWGSGNLTNAGLALGRRGNHETGILQGYEGDVLEDLGLSKCRENPINLSELNVVWKSEPASPGTAQFHVRYAELVGKTLSLAFSEDLRSGVELLIVGEPSVKLAGKSSSRGARFAVDASFLERKPVVLILEGRRGKSKSKEFATTFHLHWAEELEQRAASDSARQARRILAQLDSKDQGLLELVPLIADIVARRIRRASSSGQVAVSKRAGKKEVEPETGEVQPSDFIAPEEQREKSALPSGLVPDDLGLLVDYLAPHMGGQRSKAVKAEEAPEEDDFDPRSLEAAAAEDQQSVESDPDGQDSQEEGAEKERPALTQEETAEYYMKWFGKILRRYARDAEGKTGVGGASEMLEVYVLVILALSFIQRYATKDGLIKHPAIFEKLFDFLHIGVGSVLAKPSADSLVRQPAAAEERFAVAILVIGFYYEHLTRSKELWDPEDDELPYWRKRTQTMVLRSLWISGCFNDKKRWPVIVERAERTIQSQLTWLWDTPKQDWTAYLANMSDLLGKCKALSERAPVPGGSFDVGMMVWKQGWGPCFVDRGSGGDKVKLSDFVTEIGESSLPRIVTRLGGVSAFS